MLAARAAAQAPEGDRRGDARDRLLAVLLDDPMRAVGAAVDLQECQERIDRLTAGLKDERGRLGDVLGRLAGPGSAPTSSPASPDSPTSRSPSSCAAGPDA